MSIGVFSQLHKDQIGRSIYQDNLSGPFIYETPDGGEVEVTAVLILDSCTRYTGELTNDSVRKCAMDNRYYVWPDMKFVGIVTKYKRVAQ